MSEEQSCTLRWFENEVAMNDWGNRHTFGGLRTGRETAPSIMNQQLRHQTDPRENLEKQTELIQHKKDGMGGIVSLLVELY